MIYTDGDTEFSNDNTSYCTIPVHKGIMDDIYIETWWCNEVGGKSISIAYHKDIIPMRYYFRELEFKKNEVTPTFLRSYTVPPNLWEKLKQEFNLTD